MLDLGTSFLASVARDPDALAIVDGGLRLSYRAWYDKISALVDGFDHLGLKPGDHLVTVLQNRWEAATIHWACQFAGIIVTPLNWRATAEDLDFCIDDAEAKAIVYEDISAAAVRSSKEARTQRRICVGNTQAQDAPFDSLIAAGADGVRPRVDAEAWSVMLYTSGTTARPKGVPRRQRAERAAALAHVAQNLYAAHERTLGAMPLYHTMGARSLLAMSLVGGAFVCLPRFEAGRALELIAAERITNLYLVPTLYHDLLHHPRFAASDLSSVRKLGFAGAPMTDGLLKSLKEAFKPELFVNHYGSSEIYTFTIDQNAPAKPGSAGRVDDMIISGGENISPVEIESCLSLHPAVSEIAVVGLADERWGKIVAAFVKRCSAVEPDELDDFCRASGLASYKRPRRYLFVQTIPRSPVGKLLRRKLLAGEYEPERAVAMSAPSKR